MSTPLTTDLPHALAALRQLRLDAMNMRRRLMQIESREATLQKDVYHALETIRPQDASAFTFRCAGRCWTARPPVGQSGPYVMEAEDFPTIGDAPVRLTPSAE